MASGGSHLARAAGALEQAVRRETRPLKRSAPDRVARGRSIVSSSRVLVLRLWSSVRLLCPSDASYCPVPSSSVHSTSSTRHGAATRPGHGPTRRIVRAIVLELAQTRRARVDALAAKQEGAHRDRRAADARYHAYQVATISLSSARRAGGGHAVAKDAVDVELGRAGCASRSGEHARGAEAGGDAGAVGVGVGRGG